MTRTPMQRIQVEVAQSGYLQAAGKPQAALDRLAQLEAELQELDAPLVHFDAARTRALALRELRVDEVAEEQAQLALAIAYRQGWPQHVRRMVAEFGLEATTTELVSSG